jgi:peptidoglycan/LPS O-acetylase OafA/YrhL
VETRHIEQLTWLRGVAAFFVIISHVLQATSVSYASPFLVMQNDILSLFDLGSYGVVLFFSLSGCTLYLSNSHKVKKHMMVNFYIKRFFRIWPAYIIALSFYMVFRMVFEYYYINPQGYWIEPQFLSSYSLNDLLSYITLTFNFTGNSGLFNNAFWSLPIEFQYYLFFPLMVLLLHKFGPLSLLFFAVSIYFVPRLGVFPEDANNFFTLAYSFIGGVWIGWFYQQVPHFKIKMYIGLLLLSLVFFGVSLVQNNVVALPDYMFISNKWNWFSGFALLAVFITLFTPVNIKSKKLNQFLNYYGMISYSTYLYHNLVIGGVVLFIFYFEVQPSLLLTSITAFITLLLTYLLAAISYQYVEKVSIAIGKRLT